jgi:hypothetical protein
VLTDGDGTKTSDNKAPEAPVGVRYEKVATAPPANVWQLITFPTPAKGGGLGPCTAACDKDKTLKLCCAKAEKTLIVYKLSHCKGLVPGKKRGMNLEENACPNVWDKMFCVFCGNEKS